MITNSPIYKTIQENDLYVFPLYSINLNKNCNCGKNDCTSPGKHPIIKYNWKIVATKDNNKINKWVNKYTNTINWAVPTGRKSNKTGKYLIVIDVDSKQHSILKNIPKTFGYSTGNGYHFWFWSEKSIKSSVSLISKKVDIRAKNGYVVVPPSKHISGKKYQFINGENCEILDLPDYFKTHIKKEEQEQIKNKIEKRKLLLKKNIASKTFDLLPISSIRKIINTEKKIPEGSRNKTVFRLLCSDRTKGLEEDQLKNNANYYKNCCQNMQTITNNEINQLVNSVSKYPPRNTFVRKNNNFSLKGAFFDNFIPSKTHWISLKTVETDYRMEYGEPLDLYEAANFLKQKGFIKRRTSKGNEWGMIYNGKK